MSKDKPGEIEEMDWDANARNLKGTIRAHFSFILTLESQPRAVLNFSVAMRDLFSRWVPVFLLSSFQTASTEKSERKERRKYTKFARDWVSGSSKFAFAFLRPISGACSGKLNKYKNSNATRVLSFFPFWPHTKKINPKNVVSVVVLTARLLLTNTKRRWWERFNGDFFFSASRQRESWVWRSEERDS